MVIKVEGPRGLGGAVSLLQPFHLKARTIESCVPGLVLSGLKTLHV